MNKITVLSVPHANFRDTQDKPVMVTIVMNQVFSWYFSMASKSLHVMSTAGGYVPVLMSNDQFTELYLSNIEQPVTTE